MSNWTRLNEGDKITREGLEQVFYELQTAINERRAILDQAPIDLFHLNYSWYYQNTHVFDDSRRNNTQTRFFWSFILAIDELVQGFYHSQLGREVKFFDQNFNSALATSPSTVHNRILEYVGYPQGWLVPRIPRKPVSWNEAYAAPPSGPFNYRISDPSIWRQCQDYLDGLKNWGWSFNDLGKWGTTRRTGWTNESQQEAYELSLVSDTSFASRLYQEIGQGATYRSISPPTQYWFERSFRPGGFTKDFDLTEITKSDTSYFKLRYRIKAHDIAEHHTYQFSFEPFGYVLEFDNTSQIENYEVFDLELFHPSQLTSFQPGDNRTVIVDRVDANPMNSPLLPGGQCTIAVVAPGTQSVPHPRRWYGQIGFTIRDEELTYG